MSKKKRKLGLKENKPDVNDKYAQVLSALIFLGDKVKEEENREIARQKAKKVIVWLTLAGGALIIAFSQISTYSFNFSWLGDAKKWYSDLFVSFSAYIFVFDIVFLLEKYCKLDQKPIFGYIWPFIGFFISLFLTNSINVAIVTAEPRMNIVIFVIVLIPAAFLITSLYRNGKAINKQKADNLNKALAAINDNPSITKKILSDTDEILKNEKK